MCAARRVVRVAAVRSRGMVREGDVELLVGVQFRADNSSNFGEAEGVGLCHTRSQSLANALSPGRRARFPQARCSAAAAI